ncbi:MAG: hypothetical protein ACP5UN_00650 [Candidatus Micrarchaeia archaeon]
MQTYRKTKKSNTIENAKRISINKLIKIYGRLYSEELGIKLSPDNEKEIFKWFIASVLFGAPINEANAKKTFFLLDKYKINTPERILKAGWDKVVRVLDEGGYTRYDFKTADKLLELAENIKKKGGIIKIYKHSKTDEEFKLNLMNLAKGIGNTTVNIFLRDMYGIWKVNPEHTNAVLSAANKLNIKLKKFNKYLDTALIRYIHKK